MEIEIVPVTAQNRAQALAMGVGPGQEGTVEPVAECLREAEQVACWRPVLLLCEDEAVGFAMYGHWAREDRVWLDRFLIDAPRQGQGLAKACLGPLLSRIEAEYGCQRIYLSVVEGNRIAERLYERFGFARNGERDIHGEHVMVRESAGLDALAKGR